MELNNAIALHNLKKLIEHEDLIILSANDRQGLKKQWLEKESMYMN